MARDFITIVRSARRSRTRVGVMASLAKRRIAYAQQIADDIGAPVWMVNAAIRGRRPYFAPSLSLLRLGLVGRGKADGRPCYVITPVGARVARRLREILADELGKA